MSEIQQFTLEHREPAQLLTLFIKLFKSLSKSTPPATSLALEGIFKDSDAFKKFSLPLNRVEYLTCHQPIPQDTQRWFDTISEAVTTFQGDALYVKLIYPEHLETHFEIALVNRDFITCKGIALKFCNYGGDHDESQISSFQTAIVDFLKKNLDLPTIQSSVKMGSRASKEWPAIDLDVALFSSDVFTYKQGDNDTLLYILPKSGRIEDALKPFFYLFEHNGVPIEYSISLVESTNFVQIYERLTNRLALKDITLSYGMRGVDLSFVEELENRIDTIEGKLQFRFATQLLPRSKELENKIICRLEGFPSGPKLTLQKMAGSFSQKDIACIEAKSSVKLEEWEKA